MLTYPFLPDAVQVAHEGELGVRRKVEESELPEVRRAARCARICLRMVRVTSSCNPDEFWAFSKKPIPYNGNNNDREQKIEKSSMA